MNTREWREVLHSMTPRQTLEEDRRLVEAVCRWQAQQPDWCFIILLLLFLGAALFLSLP